MVAKNIKVEVNYMVDGRIDHMVHTCLSCSCVGYREEYTQNFIEIPI
jgi:hypothetical protein